MKKKFVCQLYFIFLHSERFTYVNNIRMYAIVDVAGQQFKVEKDQRIYVHRLKGGEGDRVEFDQVLLIDSGEKVLIGEPVIEGAQVTGKIIQHLKGDKVKVFKKKRRKGYQNLRGHRQLLSQVLIEEIIEKRTKKKEAVKEEKPKGKALAPKADRIPGEKITREEGTKKTTATTRKKVTKTKASKAPGTKKPAATKSAAKPETGVKTATTKTSSKTTSVKEKTAGKTTGKKPSPKKSGSKGESA